MDGNDGIRESHRSENLTVTPKKSRTVHSDDRHNLSHSKCDRTENLRTAPGKDSTTRDEKRSTIYELTTFNQPLTTAEDNQVILQSLTH